MMMSIISVVTVCLLSIILFFAGAAAQCCGGKCAGCAADSVYCTGLDQAPDCSTSSPTKPLFRFTMYFNANTGNKIEKSTFNGIAGKIINLHIDSQDGSSSCTNTSIDDDALSELKVVGGLIFSGLCTGRLNASVFNNIPNRGNITKIAIVNDNTVTALDADMFKDMDRLRRVSFTNLGLTSPNFFSSLPSTVTYLNLYANSLGNITVAMFQPMLDGRELSQINLGNGDQSKQAVHCDLVAAIYSRMNAYSLFGFTPPCFGSSSATPACPTTESPVISTACPECSTTTACPEPACRPCDESEDASSPPSLF